MCGGALAPRPLWLPVSQALIPDLVIDPEPLRDLGRHRMSEAACWEPMEPVGWFCGEWAVRFNDAGLPVCAVHLPG